MKSIVALLLLAQEPPLLEKVELGEAPIKILDDRLTLRLPEGARIEARGHNIMAAPEPNARETRVVWTSGDRKMVVMAYELFRTGNKELEAQVRKEVGSWGLDAEISTTGEVGGLRICSVTPKKVDASREAVFVLGLFTLRKDGTVQHVVFYFNPKAAEDLAGCTALARKAAATIQAGGRALTREAGPRVLRDLEDRRQCVVGVPEGYTMTFQKGPDFQVATILKITPLGERGPSFNAYFGGHPEYHYKRQDEKPTVTTSPGTMLGQAVEWHAWIQASDPKAHFREAIMAIPGSSDLLTHVFLVAPDAAGIKEVEAFVETLRIAEKK